MSVISYCLCGLLVSNKNGHGDIGGPGKYYWVSRKKIKFNQEKLEKNQ